MKNKLLIILFSVLLTCAFIVFSYLVDYPPFITNIIKLKSINLIFIEYLKIICTWPVAVFATVVFLSFNFKDPLSKWFSHLKISYGGATLASDLQNVKIKDELKTEKIPEQSNPEQPSQPTSLLPVDEKELKKLAEQWRVAAYLWEYSYLNYFLVHNTKRFLLWLDGSNKTNLEAANAIWATLIPSLSEREAILAALMQHHLVIMINNNQEIEITPKGKEYVAMMLKLPPN